MHLWFMSIFKSYTLTPDNFKKVYEMYDSTENMTVISNWNGFVIKPGPMFRLQILQEKRQKICVAINSFLK